MAEKATERIRKVGTTYLDWHDRETTEQAYLSQFPSSLVEEEPESEKSLDEDPTIEQSDIPYAAPLLRAGYHFVSQVPTTKEELVAIRGIGDKGADNILEYLQED